MTTQTEPLLQYVAKCTERHGEAVDAYEANPCAATADVCDRTSMAMAYSWRRVLWLHKRELKEQNKSNTEQTVTNNEYSL